jgi:hypothetical protein
MSRLDELPPDQRAALSLLVRQRKSYAQVAVLLGIAEGAVHDRAHAALAVLAPRQARGLTPEQRLEVADYILSQQRSIAERLTTRAFIAGSEPARAWAQALAEELGTLPGASLPEVPAEVPDGVPAAGTPVPSPPAPASSRPRVPAGPPVASGALAEAVVAAPSETQPPSSRLGGALVLGGIVIVVIVAVILLTSGASSSHHSTVSKKTTASKTLATSSTPGKVDATLQMRSPSPTSRTVGEAEVVSDGSARVFAIIAENLPATHSFYYAIWLYNSPTSAKALAQAPTVGASHKLEAYGALPTYARDYHEVLLTRETTAKPTHPGQVILHGVLSLKE